MSKELLTAGLLLVLASRGDPAPRADGQIVVQGVVRDVVASAGSRGAAADLGIEATLGIDQPGARRALARTDASGRFQLEWPDSGERPLKLGIRAEGDSTHRWAYLDLEISEGEHAIDGLVLERTPWGDLQGRVVDADGAVLPNIAFDLPEMPLHFNPLVGAADLRKSKSDERGRFVVENFRGSHGPEVHVETPGWRLLEKTPTRSLDRGGWEPMTVVLVPTGRLEVRAIDARDDPVRGLEVTVSIAPNEKEGRQGSASWFRLDAQTDEGGHVRFEDVWAKRYLVVGVQREQGHWEYVRYDGELLLHGGELGTTQALVLPAGGSLQLELVVPDPLVLHGRVRDRSGAVVPKAYVQLRDAEAPSLPWDGRVEELVRADKEGRFEVVLQPPVLPERLRWIAADVLWDLRDPVLPHSLDRSTSGQKALAMLELPLGASGGDGQPFEIVLDPTLEIVGRVVGEDRKPVSAGVRAVPHGTSLVAALESLTSNFTSSSSDGSFSIRGLQPGSYDLLVELQKHRHDDSSLARARFENISAGTRDNVLTVRDPGTVRVHVAAESSRGSIRSIEVKLVRVHPRDPKSLVAERPVRDARFHSASGWPSMEEYVSAEGRSLLCDEFGLHEFFAFSSMDLGRGQPALELPPIDPGCYWIGVRAHGPASESYHPTGTGMVLLAAGAYDFTFLVEPSASLSGVVQHRGEACELAVALVGLAGEPVQCRGPNWSFDTVAGVGFGGRFHLDEVPTGTFRLRVGPIADLRNGHYLFERQVDLKPGENGPIRFE